MTFLVIHRCWQGTTLVERTFHLDNLIERFAVHSSDCLWIQFFKYFLKVYVQFSPCPFPPECLAWRLRREALWGVVAYPCPCQNFFTIVFGSSSVNTFFMSLVPFPSVLCRCSRACVACWNVTLTGPRSGKTHLLHRFALNEWFSGNQRPMFCTQDSGIAWGQALPVITKKCMAWSCLSVKSGVFGQGMQHFAVILWEMEVTNVRALKFQVSVWLMR